VDAVELLDIGYDRLRGHLPPSRRAHPAITIAGAHPNIILVRARGNAPAPARDGEHPRAQMCT
jgi:hypothetical protein